MGTPILGRGRRRRDATVSAWQRSAGPGVELHAFRGYGTPTRLRVRGRVLRATGLVRSRLGDSVIDNLRNMFHRFESDEVPGALVAARGRAGRPAAGPGRPRGGLLRLRPGPAPAARRPAGLGAGRAGAAGAARPGWDQPRHRPESWSCDPQCAVISDLDDTVLHSPRPACGRWPSSPCSTTRPPGCRSRAWPASTRPCSEAVTARPTTRCSTSNSPWNLYDLLEDFLDVQGIPRRPLLLRDWSLRTVKAGEATSWPPSRGCWPPTPASRWCWSATAASATRRSTARWSCATRAGSWPSSATSPPKTARRRAGDRRPAGRPRDRPGLLARHRGGLPRPGRRPDRGRRPPRRPLSAAGSVSPARPRPPAAGRPRRGRCSGRGRPGRRCRRRSGQGAGQLQA